MRGMAFSARLMVLLVIPLFLYTERSDHIG